MLRGEDTGSWMFPDWLDLGGPRVLLGGGEDGLVWAARATGEELAEVALLSGTSASCWRWRAA